MGILVDSGKLRKEIKRLKRIQEIWDTENYKKAIERAQKMSTHELLNWADIAGTAMAKAYADYRKNNDHDILEELRLAITTLQAVTEELLIRNENN